MSLLNHANELLKEGHYNKALYIYSGIIKQDATVIDALYNRGVCYMHL